MRRAGSVLLALVAVAVLLAACSGGGETTSEDTPGSVRGTGEQRQGAAAAATATGCRRVRPTWPARARPAFFPPSRAGLWLRKERCVYLVFSGDEGARPLWGGRPAARVRGVTWGPGGESFALTTKRHSWQVVLLRRDGAVIRRLAATGAAFFRDGRLAVWRQDGIDLLAGSRVRRLASRKELERAAGFRARGPIMVSHDPFGFERGYGREGIALTLWSRGSGAYTGWKSVVLVVSAGGNIRRASPAYRTRGTEGAVSGWAWSPDGRELFVLAETSGPPARRHRGAHDHCLDIWSAARGRRRAFCESELPEAHQSHFSKLAWAADGKRGLLNSGTIFTREGKVVGYATVPTGALTFEVQWEPGQR